MDCAQLLTSPRWLLLSQLWWWKATENIRSANISVVNGYRQTTAVIEGIQEGIVYVLRVLGFSYAGDGKKAPPVFFTLGKNDGVDITDVFLSFHLF